MISRLGPLAADHPAVTDDHVPPCPGCRERFQAGEYVGLVTIGPGPDPEEREKARARRAFTSVALTAHWACVTGQEGDDGPPIFPGWE